MPILISLTLSHAQCIPGSNNKCEACEKVTPKVARIPCLRHKITDALLSKTSQVPGHEWTTRWKDNTVLDDSFQWAASELREVHIAEGYTGTFVTLQVRRFVPVAGDRTKRSWVVNGVKRSVEIPPYAIADMELARTQYRTYVDTGPRLMEMCKRILGPQNKLLWRTYMMAFQVLQDPHTPLNQQNLLKKTLELWMSIRLSTKSCFLVGDEVLGMSSEILSNAGPLQGNAPLPPVMGAQIDSILINDLQLQLRHVALDMHQKMTTENKLNTWFTQYLTTFILLHNISLVIKHDASYAHAQPAAASSF